MDINTATPTELRRQQADWRKRLVKVETSIADIDDTNPRNAPRVDFYLSIRSFIKGRIALLESLLGEHNNSSQNCNDITEKARV